MTGVQTCALPISAPATLGGGSSAGTVDAPAAPATLGGGSSAGTVPAFSGGGSSAVS